MSRPLTTSTSTRRWTLSSSSRISSQFTMLLLLLVVTVSIIFLQAPQPINAMSTMNKNQNQNQKRSLIPSSSQPQKQKRISLSRSSSSSSSSSSPRREQQQQQQQLTPPFPNGLCGGTILEISPEETFGVENLSVLGDMMLLPRTIKIWLPPGYNNDSSNENESFNNNIRRQQQRHPVLYVHDGQNAMEDEDSWTGASWRLMGALTRLADHQLIGSNILPIVVLLPSADGDLLPGVRRRHLEYGDINFPFAQAHADFVANTVKPIIDDRFRTDPSPEHNFVMGSSLGGQASLHLMMRHPDKFGGAACLSPAFMPAMLDYVASTKGQDILRNKNGGCPKKIYIDIGGDMPSSGKSKDDDTFVRVSPIDVLDHLTPVHGWNPGYFWLDTQLQRQVTAMKKLLDKGGIEYQFRQYPGARHNERAWALRIDKPLQHLFSSNSDKRP